MRMIDELRFEPGEDRDVLVHRKMVLGVARIQRRERRLGELAGKRAQRDGAGPRRVHEQLPVVDLRASPRVVDPSVKEYRVHRGLLSHTPGLLESARGTG